MKYFKTRIITISIFCLIGFFIIGIRLFYIQILKYNYYSEIVSNKTNRYRQFSPLRGTIYDRNLQPLAYSIKVFDCSIEPPRAKGKLKVAAFSKVIGVPASELQKIINSGRRSVHIKSDVYQDVYNKCIAAGFNSSTGVFFRHNQKRCYSQGAFAGHLLGIVSRVGKGQSGVEYFWDKHLAGKTIKYRTKIDALGREIVPNNFKSGSKDIVLTIDSRVQHVVESVLKSAYPGIKAKRIMGVVQDPQTGEILAMAVYPSPNPNKNGDRTDLLKNPIISDALEPGSVLKIVPAATALELQPDVFKKSFYCERGKFQLAGNVTIHDHEKYGWLSFKEMFAYSSNIGFAKLADEYIPSATLWQFIRNFGFCAKTGINLPGEATGSIKPVASWSGISREMISFGQEISVSPLQIINAYSAIANGGRLLEPRVVKSVISPNGKSTKKFKPVEIRRVISQNTSDKLVEMMEMVVTEGTGQRAAIEGVRIAGKTGTAQKFDLELGRYSKEKYVASFGGFLPADSPKLSILIMVDEPSGDYWASSVAVPIFRDIAARLMVYFNIRSATEIACR